MIVLLLVSFLTTTKVHRNSRHHSFSFTFSRHYSYILYSWYYVYPFELLLEFCSCHPLQVNEYIYPPPCFMNIFWISNAFSLMESSKITQNHKVNWIHPSVAFRPISCHFSIETLNLTLFYIKISNAFSLVCSPFPHPFRRCYII